MSLDPRPKSSQSLPCLAPRCVVTFPNVERALDRVYLGVVTPMANEAATAVEFVRQVLLHCGAAAKVTFFAIVDPISTDDTRRLLEDYARREPRLHVVWAPENHCAVDAYVRGYREALAAGCDWILEIDAGFSHLPEQIPAFLAILEGHDCVFGSRFCPSGAIEDTPLGRRILSRGGTWLANAVLGTRLSDMTSGFELFSNPALTRVLARGIRSRAHFFQTEIRAYCHGFAIAEVPIRYRSPSPRLKIGAILDAFRQLARLAMMRLGGSLYLKRC